MNLPLLIALTLLSTVCCAQITSRTGANGSDGALTITAPGVTLFDPASLSPALSPRSDNIFRFSSVTIAPGATLKLSSRTLSGPVFWLVQGPVRIDGTIDLSGDDSARYTSPQDRIPGAAGSGGYFGGPGSWNVNLAQAGEGPDAGAAGRGGRSSANQFLVPLFGGSGGGGTELASGGGGGGALLIASSTSITVYGSLRANGGNGSDPGYPVTGGGGGSIRLVAPLIDGSGGEITVRGGHASGGDFSGADGHIRIESNQNNLLADFHGTPVSRGVPFGLFLPPEAPGSIRIVSVDGVPISNSSSPTQTTVEMKPHSGPSLFVIEAKLIPVGTKVLLRFFGEDGTEIHAESSPLVGTIEVSYSTVQVDLPQRVYKVFASADWRPLKRLASHPLAAVSRPVRQSRFFSEAVRRAGKREYRGPVCGVNA